jgi:hypothetical protein
VNIWWLADPRLLPSDMLKEEHSVTHALAENRSSVAKLTRLWGRSRLEVMSLLVLRHDLIAEAMTDRNGQEHRSTLASELVLATVHTRAVVAYSRNCEKWYQIQVDHMDQWFRRLMRRCKVPAMLLPTPWGYADQTLAEFRKEHGLDPNYYRGRR